MRSKKPEDWGSVLEAGLEGFAAGRAVEAEGKKVVMEERGSQSPSTMVLVGFWKPPGESLLFMPEHCMCGSQEHQGKKSSQNVQYASFLSPEK